MAQAADRLVVQQGPEVIQTVSLTMDVLSIGRAPENGLALPDPLVSRQHAEIRSSPAGFVLTDLGSVNGTRVGEVPLLPHQPHTLADGASIQIGPFLLTYHATLAGAQTPATDSEVPPTGQETPANAAPDVAAVAAVPARPPAVVPPATRPRRDVTVARPTLSADPREASSQTYLEYLPIIFQDSDFLARFLRIFASLWEPLEQRQDHIALYFDPRTCPASFLPWLASWLDLPLAPHWPESRRRELVAEAMDLYRWRGTRYGLTRMIEVCTGVTPQISDDPRDPFVFTVSMPAGSTVERAFVDELICAHKPAHTGYRWEVRA